MGPIISDLVGSTPPFPFRRSRHPNRHEHYGPSPIALPSRRRNPSDRGLRIRGFVHVNTLAAGRRIEVTTATTGPVVRLLGGTDNPDDRGCGRVAKSGKLVTGKSMTDDHRNQPTNDAHPGDITRRDFAALMVGAGLAATAQSAAAPG